MPSFRQQFLRTETAATRVYEERPVAQFVVDVVHGFLAFNALSVVALSIFGAGWLALLAASVAGFLYILGVLKVREKGYDPTHIPTAQAAIDRASEYVADKWQARRAAASRVAY